MQKLLGNHERGLVFVMSAPAGTGKTTLVRLLSQEFPCIYESVSCTTRPIRTAEVEGVDYHFLSKEAFKQKLNRGEFLEHAEVFGNDYATSKILVQEQQERGKHVFLVIDTQGAMKIKQQHLDAIYIFISPPSLEELKERLLKRRTESLETIEKRLSWARQEMAMRAHYDYHIINEDLHQAYTILRSIVIAEEHRTPKKGAV